MRALSRGRVSVHKQGKLKGNLIETGHCGGRTVQYLGETWCCVLSVVQIASASRSSGEAPSRDDGKGFGGRRRWTVKERSELFFKV